MLKNRRMAHHTRACPEAERQWRLQPNPPTRETRRPHTEKRHAQSYNPHTALTAGGNPDVSRPFPNPQSRAGALEREAATLSEDLKARERDVASLLQQKRALEDEVSRAQRALSRGAVETASMAQGELALQARGAPCGFFSSHFDAVSADVCGFVVVVLENAEDLKCSRQRDF